MRLISLIAILICVFAPRCAMAAITGFSFSGEVINVFTDSGDPFKAGITVDPPTLVSGHILYDPDSVPLDPVEGCDCLIYPQHIGNGFSATFGTVAVHADEYFVHVKNDRPGLGGGVQDIISIFNLAFSADPLLSKPIWVNGIEYPAARFYVNLVGAGDTFFDPSLPPSLELNRFNSLYNILDEVTTDFQVGVVFNSPLLSTRTARPGDYNISGDVEEDDYDIWRSAFGEMSDLVADGNDDDVVDAADYVVWRKYLSLLPQNEAIVPEANTLLSAVLGLLVLPARLAKRRRGD